MQRTHRVPLTACERTPAEDLPATHTRGSLTMKALAPPHGSIGQRKAGAGTQPFLNIGGPPGAIGWIPLCHSCRVTASGDTCTYAREHGAAQGPNKLDTRESVPATPDGWRNVSYQSNPVALLEMLCALLISVALHTPSVLSAGLARHGLGRAGTLLVGQRARVLYRRRAVRQRIDARCPGSNVHT